MAKRNVILADCSVDEVQSFAAGISDAIGQPVEIATSFKRKFSHGTLWGKLKYYSDFFVYAFKAWRHRKDFNLVLGWQQFYAQNFAFYSALFNSNLDGLTLVSVNFTYKQKRGVIGRIYKKYMQLCIRKLTFLHVPSHEYARRLEKELDVPMEKIIVTNFGTPDLYEQWRHLPDPVNESYVLSIGRSNRDFDFLCDIFSQPELSGHKLIILADSWTPSRPLPSNIIHHKDIVGEKSFPYIANAQLSIVPIDDPVICSGDTVLLNSMMMRVPVVVTAPSTLAEMYITDEVDGLFIERNASSAAIKIASLLADKQRLAELGDKARETYTRRFSRYAMGQAIGEAIQNKSDK